MNNNTVEINTVHNGDNNSLIKSGTFLSKKISNLATTNPIINAIIIPPWNPTNSIGKPKILITSGTTLPDPTEYAFAKEESSIIAPTIIPKIGFPPYLLVAL